MKIVYTIKGKCDKLNIGYNTILVSLYMYKFEHETLCVFFYANFWKRREGGRRDGI